MDEIERNRIVSSLDAAVAIFIVILGILVIVFSLEWNNWVDELVFYSPKPYWLYRLTWIIVFLGITTIIYGIRRVVQDAIR